jgi:hypothetical protein
MSDARARYAELVQELDLQPGDNETLIGRRRGFPVALKLIASTSSVLLLCLAFLDPAAGCVAPTPHKLPVTST